MNAYSEVLDIFKTSLDNNIDVNTVTQGDEDEIDLDNKNIYPLSHITIDTGTFREQVNLFNVSVFALDQLSNVKEMIQDKYNKSTNEIDLYNTMHAVLRRTYNELACDKYTKDIIIIDEPEIEKVENKNNGLIGWRMDLTIEVPEVIIRI